MNSSSGILTIDLSAIQRNWLSICRHSGLSKSSVSAVIKADAYGLGADKVGLALYEVGCRVFFLATIEEAKIARDFLPLDATLFVLGGVRPGSEDLFFRYKLTPVFFSFSAITEWALACKVRKSKAPCAIKINTGMTRLGLDLDDENGLDSLKDSLSYIDPVLVMSHLACADHPEHPSNRQQLGLFQNATLLFKNILPDVRFSLANSSGIFLGGEWHFDLVRPGAALYGVNPQLEMTTVVESVVQLDLPILQIRNLNKNASVGYGCDAHADSSTKLAVVAGGYADGLHRILGRFGVGVIDDKEVPVIGRISMDTTIFDVSGIEDRVLNNVRSSIQVLNKAITVDVVSARNGALGYEVLTSLAARRYQRRYMLNGQIVE